MCSEFRMDATNKATAVLYSMNVCHEREKDDPLFNPWCDLFSRDSGKANLLHKRSMDIPSLNPFRQAPGFPHFDFGKHDPEYVKA